MHFFVDVPLAEEFGLNDLYCFQVSEMKYVGRVSMRATVVVVECCPPFGEFTLCQAREHDTSLAIQQSH